MKESITVTSEKGARVLLRKAEFLYFCNSGRLRIQRHRVVPFEAGLDRVFAVSVSTSPNDVDNCVVIELTNSWGDSAPHELALKKDLIWLDARYVSRISPVREIDEQSVRASVSTVLGGLVGGSYENDWRHWFKVESTRIALHSTKQLLAATNQKLIATKESNSLKTLSIIETILGFDSASDELSSDLLIKFLSKLPVLIGTLGSNVNSIQCALLMINAWAKLNLGIGDQMQVQVSDAVTRHLQKMEKLPISVESLVKSGNAKKVRSLEHKVSHLFNKEIRPLTMAVIAETNYRLAGEVFNLDDFKRCLAVVEKFEGRIAARTYTLFVACRLGPEVVYLSTHETKKSISHLN